MGDGENGGDRELLTVGLRKLLDRRPLQELHDEKRRAVFRDVVVDHLDGGGVTYRIGDVTLAQEALADVLASRDFGAKQLDGDALLVAVRGRVDDGHAPHADDTLEAVFAAQDLPHAIASVKARVIELGFRRGGAGASCMRPPDYPTAWRFSTGAALGEPRM